MFLLIVTFKDLQKAGQSQQQSGPELNTIPRDIPFWIFNQEQHRQEDIGTKGQCCFWHIIKAATKGRERYACLTISKNILRSTPKPQTDCNPKGPRHWHHYFSCEIHSLVLLQQKQICCQTLES